MFSESIQHFYLNNHMYVSEDLCFCRVENKKKLLITIGESWTWGDSLDPALRLKQVWGSKLSEKLDRDWLNIARKGASNYWIFYQLVELARYGTLPYEDILVVFCCTEAGREFTENWGWYDTALVDCLRNRSYADNNSVFETLNNYNISKLTHYLSKLQPMKVLLTHNFCSTRYWKHNYPQLSKNWVDLTADKLSIEINSEIPTIAHYEIFKKYCPDILGLIELQNRSLDVISFLEASPYNFKKASKHPNSHSHEFWADYVFNQLCEQE